MSSWRPLTGACAGRNDPRRASGLSAPFSWGNPRCAGRVGGGSHQGHSVNFPANVSYRPANVSYRLNPKATGSPMFR